MNDPHELHRPGPPAYVPTLTQVVVLPSGAIGPAPVPGPAAGGAGVSGPESEVRPEAWRHELRGRLSEALSAALRVCPALAELDRQALLEAARDSLPEAVDQARLVLGPQST